MLIPGHHEDIVEVTLLQSSQLGGALIDDLLLKDKRTKYNAQCPKWVFQANL